MTYGVLMPAVAATMLTGRYAGRTGLRELYVRLRLWRVGRWWLPVLLIQPCVLVIAAAGEEPDGADWRSLRGAVRLPPALSWPW